MQKSTYFALVVFLFLATLNSKAQEVVWSTTIDSINNFSSPRASDLNGDGVLDIVVGGGEEFEYLSQSVSAFDGATGEILWNASSRDEIFGSAIFQDITNDGTDDVFITGRNAEFIAINGATGDVVWEYYPQGDTQDPADEGLYNFYNPQFVPDQTNDGILDILVSNGGDKLASSLDTIRPPGRLMVINAANGELLASDLVPDNKEAYVSPLVYDFNNDGDLEIIFGTGGYTVSGSLWETSLSNLMNNDISSATELFFGGNTGFVAPPSLADVTGDGIADIIAPGYSKRLKAINGASKEVIWELFLENSPNTETLNSPTIGFFNNDNIPDVYTSYAIGLAPSFVSFFSIMLDGASGEILHTDTVPGWNLISSIAVDLDGDGIDEVIRNSNAPFTAPPFTHKLEVVDFNDDTVYDLTSIDDGVNLGSTPWIGDMDNDGNLDLVYTQLVNAFMPNNGDGARTKRIDLQIPAPEQISWASYLGTNYNGLFEANQGECAAFNADIISQAPCNGENSGSISAEVLSGMPPYIVTWNGLDFPPSTSTSFDFQNLAPGTYSIAVTDANECSNNLSVNFDPSTEIELNPQIIYPTNSSTNDGSIAVYPTGGTGNYTYTWEGEDGIDLSDLSINIWDNIIEGTAYITVTDDSGCAVSDQLYILLGNVEEEFSASNISIYPNPNRGTIQVQLPESWINTQFNLYNAHGQKIQKGQLANNLETLNLLNKATGLYLIEFVNNGERLSKSLVIH